VTRWVRTHEALRELAGSLAVCRAIGLDTESDSLYHHFEKVCLVQLAAEDGTCYLVDTLVLRDLSALAPLMADAGIVKVLHGADYDVCSLKRDFGWRFASIVDTMIAARLLGRRELGLAAVAREELGVSLSKDNQKDDWSRRPLTPGQEAYAAADVAHLVELWRALEVKLEAAGRRAWLQEECEAVAALVPALRRRDPEAFLSVKGARRLPPRALAALRELYAWREARAEQLDRPAFKVLGNETLLRLAELPEGRSALPPELPPHVQRHAAELLAAISRAHALPADKLPVVPRSPRPVLPEAALRRVARLKGWRSLKAAELQLEASVVLPQRLIDRLVETAPGDLEGLAQIEGLRRWRVASFGPELLAAL
jgi:ribonuclease D